MTEDEARAWLERHVPRETIARFERIVELISAEMARQNLISKASATQIWARHIVDSAQLLPLTGDGSSRWIDIGSGAGFPGLVIAAAGRRVTMIEPRPKRTAFLAHVVEALGLDAEVLTAKAQTVERKGDVISARAVAPTAQLFEWTTHLAASGAVWLLPKGRSALSELAEAKRTWQGVFHVESSVTDAHSGIIVARQVRRRRG